jgi:hypothetical protein
VITSDGSRPSVDHVEKREVKFWVKEREGNIVANMDN